MEYEIESNIPEPSGYGIAGSARATLAKMEVGQSVLVNGKSHHKEAAAFRQAARDVGCKVRTKTAEREHGDESKTRVWKVGWVMTVDYKRADSAGPDWHGGRACSTRLALAGPP